MATNTYTHIVASCKMSMTFCRNRSYIQGVALFLFWIRKLDCWVIISDRVWKCNYMFRALILVFYAKNIQRLLRYFPCLLNILFYYLSSWSLCTPRNIEFWISLQVLLNLRILQIFIAINVRKNSRRVKHRHFIALARVINTYAYTYKPCFKQSFLKVIYTNQYLKKRYKQNAFPKLFKSK